MKIGNNLPGFRISAKGLSIQRKKMNLIAENIANAENIRTSDGQAYQRKYMVVSSNSSLSQTISNNNIGGNMMKLRTSNAEHFSAPVFQHSISRSSNDNLNFEILKDDKVGEIIFMPNHPDADEKGYVQMSNVSIVEEMVEMIAATRSYEANLTALEASKEMAKDSLRI